MEVVSIWTAFFNCEYICSLGTFFTNLLGILPLCLEDYGDSDVLNLSSKSDSREDLSDAGLGSDRRTNDEIESGEGGGNESRGRPSTSPSPLREASASTQNSKYHQISSAYNSYNHHSLLGRHHPDDEEEQNDKDEPLSDNDDFDDKNGSYVHWIYL